MKKGLYDTASEHDACGIGMVVNIRGDKTHELVVRAMASCHAAAGSVDAYFNKITKLW